MAKSDVTDKQLAKAAEICKHVAEQRKRWGKMASLGDGGLYSDGDILDALVVMHDVDLFNVVDEKEARILANRQKGMAEARAKKYKDEADQWADQYGALLEEYEAVMEELAKLREEKNNSD